jgi:tRNA (guanine-N7-)-methyltransferase
MERYRRFLVDGGIIHLKTDSNFMATYTRLMAEHNSLPIEEFTDDLYGMNAPGPNPAREDSPLTSIRTYYEQMWLDRGIPIKYIRFRLPHEGILSEPDVEIPIDEYRSYDHEVKTTVKTRK